MSNAGTDFTQGAILPQLVKFSIPLLGALLLQAAYGATDLLIVGQFGDATGVSAVAIGSQIMQAITGLIAGLAAGSMISLAQFVGAKDDAKSAGTLGVTIVLFLIITLAFTVLLMLFPAPLAAMMQAPPEAFAKTVDYVFICGIGTVFIVGYNVISNVLRAIGNSVLPLLFVVIAAVVNLLLDLVLVGWLGMDAIGAAIATISAQAVSVVISLFVIRWKGLPFPFSRKDIRARADLIKRVLKLGIPVALQDLLSNISFLVIFAMVNSMGLTASAALGIGEKVCVFIMLVPMAYMSAVGTFTAQNIGAAKPQRAKKSMQYGVVISLVFGVAMFVVSFWFGNYIAMVFSHDQAVIEQATLYLQAYAFDCILVCVLFNLLGFFNGCGRTTFVMVQGLIQAFAVRLPLAVVVSQMAGATLFHIGLAYPAASVVGIVLCLIFYRKGTWKKGMAEFVGNDQEGAVFAEGNGQEDLPNPVLS